MPEETNPNINKSPVSQPDFQKKTVEQPILNSALRDRLSGNNPVAGPVKTSGAGFKNFYAQNKIYFWGILGGILIISLLSFFAFRKTPATAPKEANVNVTIAAPETVASASQLVYQITLENKDSQKLTNLQLELTYPDGETYVSSSPNAQNLSGTLFPVPDLLPGQNATIFVKAQVTGSVNDQKTLTANLHYKYSNFNSEFIKQQSVSVRLVASDIVFELDGPQTANNAQLVIYNLKYQNNSTQDIQNAQIKITYPDGFQFSSAQPQPDIGSNTWSLPALAKGGSGTITVQGNFNSANPGESKIANAEFDVLGSNGQYAVQNSSSYTTQMASLPLLVSQQLAADHPGNVVDPGDTLTFGVTFQNNNSTAATGVNITVTLDPTVLDLSTIKAEGGQVSGNTITWNAASFTGLDNLLPNQPGQLSFQVRVKNPATRDSSKNLTVVSNIKIKSNEYQTAFPGNTLTLKVSSPMTLTPALSFVSGSLPPQVGKTTTYKVRLALTNSSNDFSNGVLTLFLPLGAGGYVDGSVNFAETNNVQYDSSANKLTWTVGSLAAYTGKFSQARALEFSIRLNPSASQVNTNPVLVKAINFTGTDNFTSEQVTASADDLTTADLPGAGFSNGSVQP